MFDNHNHPLIRIQKSKITGSYQKKQKPSAVIPAKTGIQKPKATEIYRKNRNFSAVIPAKAGIQIRKLQKFIGNN